ncbi:serine/threonine-protein kinase [Calothrix sp. PCC 6303]|uniref:serine/threonine-protein kinase n=1 Tax=Calothrix sp. PCC 6303 TaxID=1170562 RepID=UPI0002A034A4|nr:serine/threonine-protein kinase [Calothrix sp. PCC 6303]AFY99759.1 serine/threonine protein kinase with WD40 repeats [Calothrix sp. PCC 6303]
MSFCINPHCTKPQNTDTTLFCQSCGSELLLEGRYRVINYLGGGGFGKTYEVLGRDNSRQVLKVLLHNYPKAVSLFQQEAQVLSQLDHPGIPKGNGYFTFLPNNAVEPLHCLVMEKIEGLNLEQYLQQRKNAPISQDLAVEWLNQLFNILHKVHSQNFFHRDIKPSNIMLKGDGQLVLIDFGAAREVTSTYIAKQAIGQITGISSPGYTPPEQLNGQAVLNSDFFAVGRTFAFLLTGKTPTDPDIYDPNSDELRWQNFAPGISTLLANLINDLMRRSPSQRPQSTQEILQRLGMVEKELRKYHATTVGYKTSNNQRWGNQVLGGLRFPRISAKTIAVAAAFIAAVVILTAIPFYLGTDFMSMVLPSQSEKWAKKLTLANTLTGHAEAISSIAITPNGETIASGSHDQTIKLWNSQTGKLIRTIYGHTLPVSAVAISPDGQQLVSGSLDETIKQWELNSGKQIRSLKTDGYVAWNNAIAITKDGQTLATGGTDKTIRLWNFTTGQRLRTLYGHNLPVLSLAISPNSQTLASGSTDRTVRLWNITSGQQTQSISVHTGWVTAVAFTPDNQTLVSGSLDKSIKVWKVNTGELVKTLAGHSYSVLSLAVSPDGKILASGGLDGEIRLWNLETGKLVHVMSSAHSGQVISLSISQDGSTLISGGADNTIKVWRSR